MADNILLCVLTVIMQLTTSQNIQSYFVIERTTSEVKYLYKLMGFNNYQYFIRITPEDQITELLLGLATLNLEDLQRIYCFKVAIRFIHMLANNGCNLLL